MKETETAQGLKTEGAIRASTGLSREVISLIETENVGFLVSISRSVKVGRTAAEISTIKLEGHAKDKETALVVLKDIDSATKKFIEDEANFYALVLKDAPNKPSPAEARP